MAPEGEAAIRDLEVEFSYEDWICWMMYSEHVYVVELAEESVAIE